MALTGLVRDKYGKKMSKSRGNVVDPLDWMDQYGSDALRFTLARGANPGTDVPISDEWVAGSRNFCTKLWNATRFALLNGATVEGDLPPASEQSVVDRWILSRLAAVTAQVDAGYEDFQFAKTTDALYHFVWDEVCDWYLELAKLPLARRGRRPVGRRHAARARRGARRRAAAAAPRDAVRHRGAVDRAHRCASRSWSRPGRAVGAFRATAPRPGRGGRGRRAAAAGHRGAPVPERPGPAARKRVPARITGLAGTLAGHEAEIRSLATLDAGGAASRRRRSSPPAP